MTVWLTDSDSSDNDNGSNDSDSIDIVSSDNDSESYRDSDYNCSATFSSFLLYFFLNIVRLETVNGWLTYSDSDSDSDSDSSAAKQLSIPEAQQLSS